MAIKNKIELLTEPLNLQTNYNTEIPQIEEIEELFFYQTEEQDERDTIYSLLAEMRGV